MKTEWKLFGTKDVKFDGFQTINDPEKITDGGASAGYNTTSNDGDRISPRKLGYAAFPGLLANGGTNSINSIHTFKKRDGSNIMMRSNSTILEYLEEANDTWVTLQTGYTPNKKFGYADYNINTDLHSFTYFGNGYENYSRWGGAHAIFSVANNSSGWISLLNATPTVGGSGYAVNDSLTITGGTATALVTGIYNNSVTSTSIQTAGTGYTAGDLVTLGIFDGSGVLSAGSCTITVNTVSGPGAILTYTITSGGYGYASSANYTIFGGTGNKTAVFTVTTTVNGAVSAVTLQNNSSGYASGTGKATTGGTGTGATLNIVSTTSNTINVTGTTSVASLGFVSAGTINVGGTLYAYSGIQGNTFYGITPDPTSPVIPASSVIFQPIETFALGPKGNIFMNAQNRIFVSGDPNNQQAVYFTKYGDATNFTGIATLVASTTLTSAGVFNLGEGGGAVTGMTQDEGSLYFFKEAITYKATLNDATYTLAPLKPFDSRSQTMGAVNGAVFTGGNGVILITADNQILNLTRIDYIDYPQATAISDDILPTTQGIDFTSATGIVFNINAYIACKSSSSVATNDTVLIYNFMRNNWDTPIRGWNVTDWTIYDDGEGKGKELYFASAISTDVYKVVNTPTDDVYQVNAQWQTKQYDFGEPADLKVCDEYFIEGNIAQNSKFNVTALLDTGFTQKLVGTISGTNIGILFSTNSLNTFGSNKFGIQTFGDNADQSGMKRFRIYFENNVKIQPFYTMQLSFDSSGPNQQWEVLCYGMKVATYSQSQNKKLYAAFN